jgi:hypothetical protein
MWEVDSDEVEGEGKAAAKRSLPLTADLVGDWGGRESGQRLRLGGGRLDCSGRVGTVLTVDIRFYTSTMLNGLLGMPK